jgi:MoxR-like ATPase
VIFTSNGEREFPPAFKRRCLQLNMSYPDERRLREIVEAQFADILKENPELRDQAKPLIDNFLQRRKNSDLATDQLLNAIHLLTQNVSVMPDKDGETQAEGDSSKLIDAVLRALNE